MARYDRRITAGGRVNIGRRVIFICIAVVIAVALLTGGILLLKKSGSQPETSTHTQSQTGVTQGASTVSSSSSDISSKDTASSGSTDANSSSSTSSSSTSATPPDPSTVKQLQIAQLGITLDYSNTLPGMSYSIGKTAAGTTYVQLSNDQLIGDKCTDDNGVFATILKNPSTTDATTVSATVKVDGDTYGLALPSDSCTADPTLFAQYQASMKQNFTFSSLSTSTSAQDSSDQQ